jgi:hypothetical protein
MTAADDEADRLQRLAAAVGAAVSHAQALSATFGAMGHQLTATVASLAAVFAMMTPAEKANLQQQLMGALGAELQEVIQKLEGLRNFAGGTLRTNSGEGLPERVN